MAPNNNNALDEHVNCITLPFSKEPWLKLQDNTQTKTTKKTMRSGLDLSLQYPHASYQRGIGPVVCLIEDGQYLSFSIYG